MSLNKRIRRWLAAALSIGIVVGTVPTAAIANGQPAGTAGEIIAFDEVADTAANQTVPLGTPIEDLDLPDSLVATVRLAASLDEVGPEEQARESEMTMPVPVKWASSPEYDKDKAGTSIFVAEIESFTVRADLPAIAVTVGESAFKRRVAGFGELPDELRWQNTSAPELPVTLPGIAEGKQSAVPVIWQADHTYDADFPVPGLYVFTAVPGGNYTMAEGAEAPRITVYIPQSAGRMSARIVGTASDASPVEIATAAQLAEVAVLVNAGRLESFLLNDSAARVFLKLANDIDLSGYASGEGWVPIGTSAQPYKGSFDGEGHVIAGLTINRPGGTDQGLFGQIGASGIVQNLGVLNAHINVQNGFSDFAGIIAGHVYGTVQNSYATGSIFGDSYVGGVAGGVHGTVRNGYSAASVNGKINIGGIAGALMAGGTVENGYATGSVSGLAASGKIGGIAGSIDGGTLRNSVALNLRVTGNSAIGRVTGEASGGYLLSGNAAFIGIPGIWSNPGADSVDGGSKAAAEISAAGFFEARFAYDSAWTYGSGKLPGLFGTAADMPAHIVDKGGAEFVGDGTIGNPYQIRTAAELARLAVLVNQQTAPYANANKSYKLMDDLDLSAYAAGTGWTPIGTNARPFKGIFDGDGRKIAGLAINRPNSDDQGLFGAVGSGASVQNLGVTNANIVGKRYVGGITGNAVGMVKNCYVTGSVRGVNTIGGIAGYVDETQSASNGTVQNCYVSANVGGTGNYIGGIAGYVDGTVKNSYALGSVNGNSDIGGVAGHVTGPRHASELLRGQRSQRHF